MSTKTVRRMAASIIGVGESKIRFEPSAAAKSAEALTHEDVRNLIKEGAIGYVKKRGVSRARGRATQEQRRLGRKRGKGSRKGTVQARSSKKEAWMALVRAQRGLLRKLVDGKKMGAENYRKIYLMIKGRAFKSKATMMTYLADNAMLEKNQ